jgi:hypothetical protein
MLKRLFSNMQIPSPLATSKDRNVVLMLLQQLQNLPLAPLLDDLMSLLGTPEVLLMLVALHLRMLEVVLQA